MGMSFCALLYVKAFEVTFRVNGRHAAAPGGRDRLAVHRVGNVPGGKNARDIRRSVPALRDDIAI